MPKKAKHDEDKIKETPKSEASSEGKMLPKIKYSISFDPAAGPIIDQPKQSKAEPTTSKSEPSPTTQPKKQQIQEKASIRRLLQQIKEHPEVLKLLDKAGEHHKKLLSYRFGHFIQDFQNFLAKTLKMMDATINFIVHKEGGTDRYRNEVVQQARPPILFGIWVTIVTFFVFGIWATVAPLDSAAPAMGTVVVDTNKKVIQHKEGGIVEAIFVKDGDHVKQGQPLLKLSDVEWKAQISASDAQINSLTKQLELMREQVENIKKLHEKGFAQKSYLVELQLKEASLTGNLSEYESRIIAAKDAMSRLDITSPIDGIVNQLIVHTIGGVIRPGEPLLTIIPQDDNLVIDAYVDPKDIDSVHVGLKAKVRITAFKSRSTAPLDGVVVQVSPDIIEPQSAGQHPMYKVRIEVDKSQLNKISRLRNYELYPGMQAEVMIVTGERTLLQYLLDPVTSTFWHAFNEK